MSERSVASIPYPSLGTGIPDAAGVLALNPRLDRLYVERWARELGVEDLWTQIAET